jgi:putative pyoverdin transport system ATP-binding/permease protein
MLLAMIGGVSGAALVVVIGKVVNRTESLHTMAYLFSGLCLAYLSFKSASEIALLKLTQRSIFRLRMELSAKLLSTPLKRLNELGKHGLFVILTKDIEAFAYAFQVLPLAFNNAIIVFMCLAYIAWLSWQVFILFFLSLSVCLVIFFYAERRPIKQLIKVREHTDTLYRDFRSLIDGTKELQLNTSRASDFLNNEIGVNAYSLMKKYVRGMAEYFCVINIGANMFNVAIGIMLFVIPLWMPQPAESLSIIILILIYMSRPISETMNVMPGLRQANIAWKRIEQLQSKLTSETPQTGMANVFAKQGAFKLELEGVCRRNDSFENDQFFLLGPLDITINSGEILFIVGGNGSGKTTLAMVLLGLYEAESGTIIFNDIPVTATNCEDYRQHFSAVFSDFHLFDQLPGTSGESANKRATEYIDMFDLAHKVTVKDGRFSTTALSTGQRKRLALVSSYLEDRMIYLFDEWAADQDPVFKKLFYNELLPDLKANGKTVIVITHDDAYFSCADRLLKLRDGQLEPFHP